MIKVAANKKIGIISRMMISSDFLKLAVVLLLFVGCSRTPDAGSLHIFLEAQSAFEDAEKAAPENRPEEFRRSAILFQGLIDRGMKSGQIYYNLGNAWMRAEQPGQALAAYHLAKRYMPLDPYLASNRQTALAGAVPPESVTPVIEYLFFWQNWVGCRGKMQFAAGLIIATFIAGVVWLFLPHRRTRRIAVVLLLLTFVASGSVGYDWYRYDYLCYAVVTSEAVPRKGNSEQYEPVFTSPIPFGTVTIVLDERSDWQRLRFPTNQDGWLPKKQVVNY